MPDTDPTVIATCPACGLLCDDIAIEPSSGETATPCGKAVQFYNAALNPKVTSAQINGTEASLDEAVKAASELLAQSKQPLFAGLGTEVLGMRAMTKLAQKTNATLDHMHSEGTVNNTLTLQNIGYQTTTLMEVKNRADVIVVIGADLNASVPKFLEKMVCHDETLFDKPTPKVIALAPPAGARYESPVEVIEADHHAIPEITNTLKALLQDKNPLNRMDDATDIAGVTLGVLKQLVEQLKAAKYGVVIWAASALKTLPQAELATQTIVQFINALNKENRVMGLPLNSGDGDTTVNNAFVWLTGYATRSKFVNGVPVYDPRNLSTAKQIGQTDALLWSSSFNPVTPPETDAPTIVIGHPNTEFTKIPDVFIPVAVPGVHSDGQMFRMDSSITLPLRQFKDTDLPTLHSVIGQIESELA